VNLSWLVARFELFRVLSRPGCLGINQLFHLQIHELFAHKVPKHPKGNPATVGAYLVGASYATLFNYSFGGSATTSG